MTTLPYGAERALMRGRQAAFSLYTDRCHITRPAQPGDTAYVANRPMNEVTLQYPAQARVDVYRGPCRFQVKADINSNVVETTAGDKEFVYLTASLQLPVERADLETYAAATQEWTGDPALVDVDYIAEVLEAPYDSALKGRLFNIAGPYHKSHAVYRRFRIREAV